MTTPHGDLGPELRALAQAILDRLDPAVRLAAARATTGTAGKCQQVWCPVCALAALAAGEQHPLLTVVAEHSVALLAVVRAILDQAAEGPTGPDTPPDGPPGPPDDPGPNGSAPPPAPGRYQHIPVTVEE
ncbi:hypothetical protein A5790_09410 [Mycobacterium sp. 852002-51152_SCH6134967]|uniref:hypothetical protein n=1 Tax=Mycobacterium sp. 852002-51152_SCH6134967 TaxID=1834096 RepID=UPI0007FFE4C6|nr:hypothetical protein [Mycobacterium sp. 852002-51152_SCH6134967]OBF94941.1 hypothetical protein A5790_09410 [Mycobacterium sp. 852002-51152_SCH6134967]